MTGQPLGCCANTGLLFALCPCETPTPWVIYIRPRQLAKSEIGAK